MNTVTGQIENRSKRRGSRLWLIGAASALLLMALGQSPVSAAPMLSVPQNPVPIYSPATTAATTVTWSGVTVPPAGKMGLFIDNVMQPGAPIPVGGSAPLTVGLGLAGTRTVEVRDMSNGAVRATLKVTGQEKGGLCPKQGCIQKFAPVPHGTFAEFGVTTAASAKLHVEVSTAAPAADFSFASVTSSADSPLGTMHSLNLLNLKPKTLYHYVVRAEDIGGFKYFQKGTFTTLKQRIDVTFSQIHVTDDSDDLSGGDLKFWFTVENQGALAWFYPTDAVNTGAVLNIALTGTIMDSGGSLNLKVQGYDDDEDPQDDCDDVLPLLGSGSNFCADWIQKTWQSLSITKVGPGEAYTAPFSIVASEYGVPLAFTVTGTFTVSYF